MVSSTNNTDTELAAFIHTVVNMENNSTPTSERICSSGVPSSTNRGPNSTHMEKQSDAGNCMVLERVYYLSKEDRLLQQGFQLSDVTSVESLKNSQWSTQAEHCRTHEIPFLHPICEQPSTDSFLPRKSTSMETMNLKQQSSIMYSSVQGQQNHRLNGAENAVCYLDEQTNVFKTNNGYRSGQVLRNSGSANSTVYGQVKEKRTPPFCFPESRTYYPRNGGGFNQICKYDPQNDNQLQKGVEGTVKVTPSEVWNQKIHSANNASLSETWQPNHFAVKQNGNEIQSQSAYNLSGSMQMVSPKPVPRLQTHPSNANCFRYQTMRHETDNHTQKKVMAEGCYAQVTRGKDGELQNLMHPIVEHHVEHYDRRQAFGEESQIYKKGVKGVLPKRQFVLGEKRCAVVEGTYDTSILLREPHHDKTSSQINHSRAVLENNEEEESFTRDANCQSMENGGTSQESNSSLTGERPFRCPWKNCTRTFRRSHERSRHFQQHGSTVGFKSYQCSYCCRCFSRSDTWKLHLKTKHKYNITLLPAGFTI